MPRILVIVRAAVVFLALSGGLPAFAQQARYNIHFHSATYAGLPGKDVTVVIDLDNQPDRVTGFSFGVKHDAAKLALQAVNIGSGLQDALGAGQNPDSDFYFANLNPSGGTGFTVGMILSRDKPNVALQPGLGHAIFDVKYQLPALAEGDTKVEITGELGAPKVPVILDKNGVSQAPSGPPAVTAATIRVSQGTVPFLRGDANQSGRLEITDALIIFDYLFGGGTVPVGAASRDNCLVALNADGPSGSGAEEVDGDINITDGLYLLRYIFQKDTAPPAPFPACGEAPGPTSARMACQSFHCP
jgi:hypothetical protein